ncbi:MAG: hypothetical protein IJY12_02915 [Clostridia bacterium]|nr:hypothetical protein [Clostridia bacterium]
MSEQKSNESIDPKEAAEQLSKENTGQADNKKEKKKQGKEKDDKRGWYVRITILLLIIIIILILLLLRQCSSDVPVLNPDFPPQETEPNAEPIPGSSGGKLDHSEGGGAIRLTYSDKVYIDLSDKRVTLSFKNPEESTQDMLLQIVIQDQIIAQSGRLLAGYQIKNLELLEDVDKMLSEGTYSGKFVITYYDPETNERAMINTEAPVTIHVYP